MLELLNGSELALQTGASSLYNLTYRNMAIYTYYMRTKRQPKPHNSLAPEQFVSAAECLKVIAHPQRLFLLSLLERQELTVGELAERCGIPSHMASEHLRLMMRCGLLAVRAEGQKRIYSICENHVRTILSCVYERFIDQRALK